LGLRLTLALRLALGLRLLRLHLRPVMPDGTADRGARHRMMARHVTGDAADRGALDATGRIDGDRKRSGKKEDHH
jgi:hypothetical protein